MSEAAPTPPADAAHRATPAPSPRGIVLAALVGVALVGCSIIFAWVVVPRFTAIYEDFDVELPWLTVMLLTHGAWAVPLAATFFGLALVLHELLPRLVSVPTALRWLIRAVILLTLGLFAMLLVLSLWLPLMRPTESLM